MSDSRPDRPTYDVTRYKKAISAAWKQMQLQYATYRHLEEYAVIQRTEIRRAFVKDPRRWWVLPEGAWPAFADYQIESGARREQL